ncbi:NAD-dependent epimerase/dehydratase family protein [Piscirickettsia litoralis]|nr:NAD-dependent epimerase/dehydratase family protein [Piscirickettsia litoralis]
MLGVRVRWKNQRKIYVAGHRGLVGSALVRQLKNQGHDNLLLRTHDELDLTQQTVVREFFALGKTRLCFFSSC